MPISNHEFGISHLLECSNALDSMRSAANARETNIEGTDSIGLNPPFGYSRMSIPLTVLEY